MRHPRHQLSAGALGLLGPGPLLGELAGVLLELVDPPGQQEPNSHRHHPGRGAHDEDDAEVV